MVNRSANARPPLMKRAGRELRRCFMGPEPAATRASAKWSWVNSPARLWMVNTVAGRGFSSASNAGTRPLCQSAGTMSGRHWRWRVQPRLPQRASSAKRAARATGGRGHSHTGCRGDRGRPPENRRAIRLQRACLERAFAQHDRRGDVGDIETRHDFEVGRHTASDKPAAAAARPAPNAASAGGRLPCRHRPARRCHERVRFAGNK